MEIHGTSTHHKTQCCWWITVLCFITHSYDPSHLRSHWKQQVIFTFPLQAYPALEIISRTVQPLISCSNQYNGTSKKLSSTSRNIISSITVLLLSIVAIVEMESLGHVVSLVGSLLGLPIAFVFPPLIHNRLVEDPSKWTWGRFFNYLVAGLGLSGMVFATYTTLASWNDVTEGRWFPSYSHFFVSTKMFPTTKSTI